MNTNNHKLIFLVDDDETYLDMLEHHLKSKLDQDITYKKFATGEACLLEVYQQPSVIVIDHILNTKKRDASTGLSIIKKIRTACPDANIILLSGQKELDVVSKALSKYRCKYVIKNDHAFVKAEKMIEEFLEKQLNTLSYGNK